MDKGFKVFGELLASPDKRQRATFVVMNLIKALQQENEAIITASCTYLINRFSELLEVHANDFGKTVKIEFVEEGCD